MQWVGVVCVELCRRHMAEGSEQAPVAVPVHPMEGCEFHRLPVTPRTASGDDPALEPPDDGFGQSLPPA